MPGEAWAIIAAAGQSQRMGGENKLYLPLADKPVLARTLAVFQSCADVVGIILAVAAGEISRCREMILEPGGFSKVAAVIPGGKTRQESVENALAFLPPECVLVVVHDGARPFLRSALLQQAIEAGRQAGAAVVAVPVKDTMKMVAISPEGPGRVVQTLPRKKLWAAQSPQVFSRQVIARAYQQARWDGFWGTDDASLVERLGYPVVVVPGDYTNIKLTTPDDVYLAEALLARAELEV